MLANASIKLASNKSFFVMMGISLSFRGFEFLKLPVRLRA
jgi:hypothetical protein